MSIVCIAHVPAYLPVGYIYILYIIIFIDTHTYIIYHTSSIYVHVDRFIDIYDICISHKSRNRHGRFSHGPPEAQPLGGPGPAPGAAREARAHRAPGAALQRPGAAGRGQGAGAVEDLGVLRGKKVKISGEWRI